MRGASAFAKAGSKERVKRVWERKLTCWSKSRPSSVWGVRFFCSGRPALLMRMSRGLPVWMYLVPRASTLAREAISHSHHSMCVVSR